MWIRLRKELRELLVPGLQATGFTLAVALALESTIAALLGFACLCFYLAVRPLGVEVDRGTFGRLLAQPLSRSRLWWEKNLATTVALLLSAGLLLGMMAGFEHEPRLTVFWWIVPFVALASGPGWSLVLRDSTLATWVAMAVPTFLYSGTFLVETQFRKMLPSLLETEWALMLYGVVMAVWSYRRFRNFELTTGGGRQSPVATKWWRLVSSERRLHPVKQLLLKELRLQSSSLLLAGIVVAGWLADALLPPTGHRFQTGGEDVEALLVLARAGLAILAIFIVPLLIGANAVASERRIGVLSWQLALPVPLYLQWWLKLFCTALLILGVGMISGAGMMKLVALGQLPLPSYFLPDGAGIFWLTLLVSAIFGILGFYGSRHARTPFRAVGYALVMGLIVYYLWRLAGFTFLIGDTLWLERRWPSKTSVTLGGVLILGLLVWMLLTPSQEEWLARRRLRRSAILALLGGGFFVTQIFMLRETGLELDREIAISNRMLEQAVGQSTEKTLGLGLGFEQYAASVTPIIRHGVQLARQGREVSRGFWRYGDMIVRPFDKNYWKMESVSPAMRVAARYDGVDLSDGTQSRWYWEMEFFFAIQNGNEGISYRPGHIWAWRGFPGSQPYSLAPFYAHEERLEKLDLRVRQILVEKTLAVLDDVKDLSETDWETLGPLIDQSPVSLMVRATPETPDSLLGPI